MSPILLLAGLGGGFWYFFLRDRPGNGACIITSADGSVQNLLNAAWASAQRRDNIGYQVSLRALDAQVPPDSFPNPLLDVNLAVELPLCTLLQEIATLIDRQAYFEARQLIYQGLGREF